MYHNSVRALIKYCGPDIEYAEIMLVFDLYAVRNKMVHSSSIMLLKLFTGTFKDLSNS